MEGICDFLQDFFCFLLASFDRAIEVIRLKKILLSFFHFLTSANSVFCPICFALSKRDRQIKSSQFELKQAV